MVGSSKSDDTGGLKYPKRQYLLEFEARWPNQLDEAHPVTHIEGVSRHTGGAGVPTPWALARIGGSPFRLRVRLAKAKI